MSYSFTPFRHDGLPPDPIEGYDGVAQWVETKTEILYAHLVFETRLQQNDSSRNIIAQKLLTDQSMDLQTELENPRELAKKIGRPD